MLLDYLGKLTNWRSGPTVEMCRKFTLKIDWLMYILAFLILFGWLTNLTYYLALIKAFIEIVGDFHEQLSKSFGIFMSTS